MSTQRLRMGVGYLGFLARMRPGTTLASAEAELAVLNRQYREQNPNAPDADPNVVMTAIRCIKWWWPTFAARC